MSSPHEVAAYWDSVADRYLELFRDELAGKPHDMEILRRFAAGLKPGSLVCDAGCGPCGHISRFLSELGLNVIGVDISPRCIALAREEQPGIRFEVMDLGCMSIKDGSLDGLIAYYSLHYQPAALLVGVVQEFARVLRPGGKILLVAKQGEGEGWIADPLGGGRNVFWKAFQAEELRAMLSSCDFQIEAVDVREPLRDEIAVRRIYVTAERG
jgi:SAM-dependent methyltransferase